MSVTALFKEWWIIADTDITDGLFIQILVVRKEKTVTQRYLVCLQAIMTINNIKTTQ